jgi:hypothetical protein
MSLLRRLNIQKVTSLQVSAETSSKPIRYSKNYLLAREVPNEFYLRSILSLKTIGIHVSYLMIAALAVVTTQNLLRADEQSAAEKERPG